MGAAGAKAFFTCVIPGDPTAKRDGELHAGRSSATAPIARAAAEVGAKIVDRRLARRGAALREPLLHAGNHPRVHPRRPAPRRRELRPIAPDPPGRRSRALPARVPPHVRHVHAKDTRTVRGMRSTRLGRFQGSAFAKPHGFGEWTWRYTIPGKGDARWVADLPRAEGSRITAAWSASNWKTRTSTASEAGEKSGFTESLQFLRIGLSRLSAGHRLDDEQCIAVAQLARCVIVDPRDALVIQIDQDVLTHRAGLIPHVCMQI